MSTPARRLTLVASLACAVCTALTASAQTFSFSPVTECDGGPGSGSFPSINAGGDVAFMFADEVVYLFERDAELFTRLNDLPGAPPRGWYPKLNDAGNIAFVDPDSRDLWFYEAASGTWRCSVPRARSTTTLRQGRSST